MDAAMRFGGMIEQMTMLHEEAFGGRFVFTAGSILSKKCMTI
jgi:hypothetical protein